MDAVQFLLEEHQKVREKFAAIQRADSRQRGEMWRQLQPELKIHEEIEDTYLYGPLSKDPAATGTKLAGFEEHQDEDVRQLEQKIHNMQRHDPTDSAWLDGLKDVHDALMDHVREEEQEILPAISQVWDREKLMMAGQQMAQAKQEAMQNPTRYATVMSQTSTQGQRSR
jgi:hemerythrin-like domain-containing protein